MRFELGDETDRKLVQALQHEFLRCRDAFDDFLAYAPELVTGAGSRRNSYAGYNAYARLVHYLYEFLMGCASRRQRDTPTAQGGAGGRVGQGSSAANFECPPGRYLGRAGAALGKWA